MELDLDWPGHNVSITTFVIGNIETESAKALTKGQKLDEFITRHPVEDCAVTIIQVFTPIPVSLRIGFAASSTITLLNNRLTLKAGFKSFLIVYLGVSFLSFLHLAHLFSRTHSPFVKKHVLGE